MKITVRKQTGTKIAADLVAIGLAKDRRPVSLAAELNRKLGGLMTKTLKKEAFEYKAGETKLISAHGKIGARYLLVIGLGEKRPDSRRAAAIAVKNGNKIRARKVSLILGDDAEALAEGSVLGSYGFDLYKSRENLTKKTVEEVEILSAGRDISTLSKAARRGKVIGEMTNYARDLINTPASDMTPRRMADEARKIGRLPRLSAKVLDRAACKRLGMGAYLAVARGSKEPPCFLHLTYRPTGKVHGKIALVGKGVTFDSGGLSLKTAQGMETMKDDMSGAAAVLAVMKVLSETRPAVEVHGIAAATENMPSGNADKPGDIVRTMAGKTIEILNTDAEGRLTLADAVSYAIRQKPDAVIDIATLTGACVIALGELCSGIMGNDQKLVDRIIASGRAAGELLWQLPLLEEYKEEIKSSVADIKNTGGKGGGTITAALFIQEFASPKTPWAHIDIAGPSWTEKDGDLCPRGGTGAMVRTLSRFLLSY